MPQSVYGSGCVPLKARRKAKIIELAERFDGWLEWDWFEFRKGCLHYAYNDIVTVGTAGDLDDFLEEIANEHAKRAWTHFGEDGATWYYGPNERSRLEAEIAELEAQETTAREALAAARAKFAASNPP